MAEIIIDGLTLGDSITFWDHRGRRSLTRHLVSHASLDSHLILINILPFNSTFRSGHRIGGVGEVCEGTHSATIDVHMYTTTVRASQNYTRGTSFIVNISGVVCKKRGRHLESLVLQTRTSRGEMFNALYVPLKLSDLGVEVLTLIPRQ